MDKRPNLFSHGTSELSQDAFICWLAEWANPIYKETDECLYEAHIKTCTSVTKLKQEIKDYMKYYNQHRYQWNLKKMTPVEYRNHLLTAA